MIIGFIAVFIAAAHADPDVLRLSTDRLGASVGTPGVSAALWFGDRGLAVAGSRANVGVYAALRTPDSTWWRAGAAAGLVYPVLSPGLAIDTSAWLGATWSGRWADLGADLVAPAAVSILDRTARIGARLDPTVGVHFDAWSLSVSAGGGVVTSTDAGWALDLRAALGLGWDG